MNKGLPQEDYFLIASVCLYSTGHWIGATILLGIFFLIIVGDFK